VTKPTFALLDFDLNGKPDIVVTQDCVDVSVGTDSWLLYPNSGTSFAASPTTIALPSIPGVPAGSFTSLGGNAKCSNGSGAPAFTLVDLTGDTVIDFLVTQDCGDALTGVSYWQVFPNVGGAGFTSPVSKLMLPPSLNATSAAPAGLSGALDCTPPVRPAYTATYLAGLAFDLVVTGACADSTVGDTQWLLFPASCK
jgi:hypothetical protein